MQRSLVFLVCTLLLGGVQTLSMGDDASVNYSRDIRPILADHCFACHGPDAESREAELRLDQREVAVESGAIVEGSPDDSELIARILSDDPDAIMPPPDEKKPLSDHQKKLLTRWIAAGAPYEGHWSFEVPVMPEIPTVNNTDWVKNEIDHFVLAKLEAQELKPAPEADPYTLFRRLHLDITGLPPNPADVDAFQADYQQRGEAALSEWIDRLMSSNAWGEHRARYWLDAARYADTHGLHFDNYREMWIYRDWVIRAFNRNQPFDEFTVEQLAGDLLPDPTQDQLIATGFQRCNITTNEGGTIDEENLANYATDRVQTFGWVYLGLTTNCGQCHDHKFDPFTQEDFYSLAAFFRNTTQQPKDGNVADGRGPFLVVPSDEDRPRWNALTDEIDVAKSKRDEQRKKARPLFNQWVKKSATAGHLPEKDLLLHAPLNEGKANPITARIATQSAIALSSTEQGGGSDETKPSGDNYTESLKTVTLSKGKGVNWTAAGINGPAPIVEDGRVIEVAEAGDLQRDQSLTISLWVKTKGGAQAAPVLSRMEKGPELRGWDIFKSGAKYATHIISKWPGDALKFETQRNTVKANQWQHVLVTYDGSHKKPSVKIFVDGIEEPTKLIKNTLKPTSVIRANAPLRVGRRTDGSALDGGSVQDVRIYGRALNSNDIRNLFESTAIPKWAAKEGQKQNSGNAQRLFDYYLNNYVTEYPSLASAVTGLETEREEIRKRSPVTHIQEEKPDSPAMAHILMRGAYDKPVQQVMATTPAALPGMPEGAPANRLGLAQWVVDPANPLTARVTVNRFWQEIFGTGIVATPEDFGVMGAPPSHPELMDWLAVEFQQSGWDVKKFFKTMLMSATYRQTARATPKKIEKDRDNTLLSRGPRFRMDAEMVRDYALASSGLISAKMFGPGAKPYQPDGIWDIVGLPNGNTRDYEQGEGEDLYRRSIYSFWKRMAPPPNLETFNAPSREVCVVRRERTNTPLQALVTLNDPQFVEAARNLSQLALEKNSNKRKLLKFMSDRVLCRPLTDLETSVLLKSRKDLHRFYASNPDSAKELVEFGESSTNDKLSVTELATWTMVCNQLMNLDEVLNK